MRYTAHEGLPLLARSVLLPCLFLSVAAACAQQHAPDGGVVERIQSISVPPVAGAPFRATVVTDWTRLLADGTRVTLRNHRTIARDSTGRVFQERRYFAPDGDTRLTMLSELDYYDPIRKEVSVCEPMRKVCTVRPWEMQADTVKTCAPMTTPQVTITCDALGTGQVDNVETVGSREIRTVVGGPMGLKTPEPTIREFWFAPRLGVNLTVKRFEPRGGAQNFYVRDLTLSEPDAALFQLPQGFKTARTVIE